MNKRVRGNRFTSKVWMCLVGALLFMGACADSSSTGPSGNSDSEIGDAGLLDGSGHEGGELGGVGLGGGKLTLTILSPLADTAVLANTPVALSAKLHSGETSVPNGMISWTEEDAVIAQGVTGADGVSLLDLEGFLPGLHPLEVKGVTPSGEEVVATIEVRAVEEPTAPVVVLFPENPGAADAIKAEILEHSFPVGGEGVTYYYQWQVNGVIVTSATTDLLSASVAFRGDEVRVRVTPLLYGYPGPFGEASVVIGNTPPAAKSAKLEPNAGHAMTLFECVAEGWGDVDGDEPADWIRWERNGEVVEGLSDKILPVGVAKRGDSIRCELTPHDGWDPGPPKWSFAVVLGNAPPSVAAASVTPNPGSISVVFTCHGEGINDPDGDDVSLLISWLVNDVLTAGVDEALPGVSLKKGDFVACVIQPDDGELLGDPVLSAAIQIGNASPVGMTPTIIPSVATVVDLLTCEASPATDPDGEATDYLYTWSVNGVPVGGDKDLAAPAFQRGDSVVCIVTPTDGVSTGPSMASEPVVIGNAPPFGGTADISPADLTVLSILHCDAQDAFDPDGDDISWLFEWEINGTDSGVDGETLIAPAFEKGDEVLCVAYATDGMSVGDAVQSPSVIIGNAAPTVGYVSIVPDLPTSSSVLSCDVQSAFDPDGDGLTFYISWIVNGQVVASGQEITLSTPAFVGGDMVHCSAVASDGENLSLAVESDPVVIGNTPPLLSAAFISPSAPTVLDMVSCIPIGWFDADDDAPGYLYQWTFNGAVLSFETGAVLEVPIGSKGASIGCAITPDDGIDKGEPVSAPPVIVSNAPPFVGNASIIPGLGNQNTLFTCFASLIGDPDGDEVSLSFSWFVNDSKISGANESILQDVQFPEDGLLYCEVTPNDGESQGSPILSAPATLLNAVPFIGSASLVPKAPITADDLECIPGGWFDSDDDAPQYLYAWFLNGQVVGEDSSMLSQAETSRGELWQCQIYPYDGLDIGTPVASDVVEIGNTAPTIQSVWVTPDVATSLSTLECHFSGWEDPDGDLEMVEYAWTVNGEKLSWAQAVFPAAEAEIGDIVRCEVTPYDMFDVGEGILSSNAVELINAPPQVEILSPLDVQVGTGDILLFSGVVSDMEDSAEDLNVVWESDLEGLLYEGAPVGGITEFTWSGLAPGQHQITVTATDTLGAEGKAEVVLVVGFICGATSEEPTELESAWSTGFEAGNLTDWDFASYRFLVSGYLVPATCDFDEYTIQEDTVVSGDYALSLSPKQDAFLLLKLFGAAVSTASFEGWVYLPGGAGLKAGFVSVPWDNDPEGFETTGFMNLISPTKAVVYGGNDPSLNLSVPADEWFLFRLTRDVDEGTMTVYVDNVYQTTLSGIPAKPLLGMAVGISDVYDVVPDGHLDEFNYITE